MVTRHFSNNEGTRRVDRLPMLSRLALGTAQFGLNYGIANKHGQISSDEASSIIDFSSANGINTLDTAVAYGNSEQRLGEIGVKNWQVVSKLFSVPDGCLDISTWVSDSVSKSLQRLKIDNLHGLLLHRPQQLLQPGGENLYNALQQLKKKGLVNKIGVSIYDPVELDELCMPYQLDIVQAPFNIIDSRLIDSGWLSRLSDQGTELHVRSIFLQGLLLMSSEERPKKFDIWQNTWKHWDKWLLETGLTPLQACLRYVMTFSQIGKIVLGVDTLNQLTEIVEAIGDFLPLVPDNLKTADHNLLNPARWIEL